MLSRFLLMVSVLFVASACSSTEEPVVNEDITVVREDITTTDGTVVGTQAVEASDLSHSGPVPGTQEDLIVNIGDRVLFGYDSYALTAEARQTLLAQSKWLQAHPNLYVTIEGHADERGTREYNLALGERRASAVRDYLVALGVQPIRVNVISYGKERPAVAGTGSEVWAQNRRGVTVIR